jgi:hypothetical protein
MSALPASPKPLQLPRTILAMPFRSLLLNTSVAYQPHLLARFAFSKRVIAKIKAEAAAKKRERALTELAAETQRLGLA